MVPLNALPSEVNKAPVKLATGVFHVLEEAKGAVVEGANPVPLSPADKVAFVAWL